MDNQGIYVGLDIGTTSIKVIVAEAVQGQMNVIGVGSQRSEGVSRGVIVDIDKAVAVIQAAVAQAEDKANIKIDRVVAGIPANMLQIEQVSGMIAVGEENKEISDKDVRSVAAAALVRNLPPERETLSLVPTEFIVDGFDDIKDPRGMLGVRLEMRGIMLTVPKTVIHNTKKAIEKAGLRVGGLVISPLAIGRLALTDGEQDFGTVLIDMGGGQSTAAVIHDRKLKFTSVDQEGGEYITKDISVVLNTVTVVGKHDPAMISEKYLSEIIEARVAQIFKRLKKALDAVNALELPGGIVITGGTTALPGVTELAQDILERPVKRFIPEDMGLRHPSFTEGLALIKYAAEMTDIEMLVSSVLPTPFMVDGAQMPTQPARPQPETPAAPENQRSAKRKPDKQPEKAKSKEPSPLRRFFGNFFE
ncbi:cell division protein FtsA [Lacticaseibacillus rhamnosus]|uniref:cell division protein FtsA n=1 Tax=Lacticaseibacillus rhamnosus TaxID=47715 RepID=UPI00325C11A0